MVWLNICSFHNCFLSAAKKSRCTEYKLYKHDVFTGRLKMQDMKLQDMTTGDQCVS